MFTISNKKEAFIDVMKAKPVDEYLWFQLFMNCLSKDSALHELEVRVFEKKCDLHCCIPFNIQ